MSESTGRYGRRKGGLSAFDGSEETASTAGGGRRLRSPGSADSSTPGAGSTADPTDGGVPGPSGDTPQDSAGESSPPNQSPEPSANKSGPANPGDSAKHGGAVGKGLQSKLDQASGLTSSVGGVKNEGTAAAKSLAHGNTDDAANRGLDKLAGKGKGKGGVRDVASSAAKGALGTSDAGKAAGGQLTGAIAGAGTALTRNKTVRRAIVISAVAYLLPIAMIAVLMLGVFATVSGSQNAQNQGSQQNSADAASRMGIGGAQMAAFANAESATNVPWEILAGVYLQQTGGPGCEDSTSTSTALAGDTGCSSGAGTSCASPSTVSGSPPYALEATAGEDMPSAGTPKRTGDLPATAETSTSASSFTEVPCPEHASHALSPFLISVDKVKSGDQVAVSNSLSAATTWVALQLQTGMRSKSMDLFQNQQPVDPSDVGGSVTYAPVDEDNGASAKLAKEKADWVKAIQNTGLVGMDSSAASNAFDYGMALFQGHTLNTDVPAPCEVGGGYSDAGTAAATIMQYLVNAGLSPTQAAGLAGNWQVESQLNPKALNPSGGAYGLVQWMGKRLLDLHAFGSSIGKPYDGLEAQLRYAGWELGLNSDWKGHSGGAYKSMTAKLKGVSDGDTSKAADIVDWYYEINDLPGQRGPSIPDREKYAKAFYDKYKNLKPNGKAGADSVTVADTKPSSGHADPATVLKGLSASQRAGQLLMVSVQSGQDTAAVTKLVKGGVGSAFFLGSWPTTAATKRTSSALQKASSSGLFIGADNEGGDVWVVGPASSKLPTALTQGKATSAQQRAYGKKAGALLRSAGVNIDLAPVADTVPVSLGTGNGAIGKYQREYGNDPKTVSAAVKNVVSGLHSGGVAAAVKHFPGLGRIADNTDTSRTGITDTQTTASDSYLTPFKSGIDAGSDMVMIGFANYARIDKGVPAAFSHKIITTLLRKELSYSGVVVSDDLAATAVSSTPVGQRATKFIAAGGDVAMVTSAPDAKAMQSAIVAKAKSDPAFKKKVDAAALRVLTAKADRGVLKTSTSTPPPGCESGVPSEATGKAKKAIDAAVAQLHLGYVWGGGAGNPPGPSGLQSIPGYPGFGKPGFDCEGLVRYAIWKGYGVLLPAGTSNQLTATVATTVATKPMGSKSLPLKKMKPGDFILINGIPGDAAWGHVVLYMGGGKLVEAANPKIGIRTDNLDYITQFEWTVRRINNDAPTSPTGK